MGDIVELRVLPVILHWAFESIIRHNPRVWSLLSIQLIVGVLAGQVGDDLEAMRHECKVRSRGTRGGLKESCSCPVHPCRTVEIWGNMYWGTQAMGGHKIVSVCFISWPLECQVTDPVWTFQESCQTLPTWKTNCETSKSGERTRMMVAWGVGGYIPKCGQTHTWMLRVFKPSGAPRWPATRPSMIRSDTVFLGTGPFRIIRMSVIRLLRSSTFFQNRFGLVCVLIDVIIQLSHNSTFSLAKRACRIIRNGPVSPHFIVRNLDVRTDSTGKIIGRPVTDKKFLHGFTLVRICKANMRNWEDPFFPLMEWG